MARPVGLARICLLIFVAAGAARAADPVTLRETFKDGRVRYIDIKTSNEKNTIVSFFPDPIASVDEREWWIIATEGKAPKPGLTAVTWKIDRLQGKHRDMFGRERKPDQVFDSLRPGGSPLVGSLGPWTDRSLLFWLDTRGEVDQLIDPPSTRPPLNHMPTGSQAEAPSADDFRHFASAFYGLYLPEKPVNVGDKWTRPYSVKRDPYGTLDGTITYTLKSVDKRADQNVARIEFGGNLTLVPATQPARPGADEKRHEVKTATYDGWVEFDIDAGMPLAADAREDLKLNLIMTATAQPAKPAAPPAAKPAASQAATQPGAQPAASQPAAPAAPAAPKPVSYTFQLAETRRAQFSVSKTPPQKPIVVNSPPPTSAPVMVRPPQPYRPQTTQPHAPIGIAPRPIPTSQPVRSAPPRPN